MMKRVAKTFKVMLEMNAAMPNGLWKVPFLIVMPVRMPVTEGRSELMFT